MGHSSSQLDVGCLLLLFLEPWIPLLELGGQFVVENSRPSLEQQMSPSLRPLHLLFLVKSFIDDHIDRRLATNLRRDKRNEKDES